MSESHFHNPESGDRLKEHELVSGALKELAEQQHGEDFFASTAVLTTNKEVTDRQLHIVDARTTQHPHLKVFFNVNNWTELYKSNEPDTESQDPRFWFEPAGDKKPQPLVELHARVIELPSASAHLVWSEDSRSVDGLVEMRIPYQNQTDAEISDAISTSLLSLTREPLWSTDTEQESFSSFKAETYRTFHKLPEGPLTHDQYSDSQQLKIERTSLNHFSVIDPEATAGELDYAPGSTMRLKHEVMRIENAVQVIENGGLQSTLQRLQRGSVITGRSSAADLIAGGADAVYTYALPDNKILKTYEGKIRFVLKPDVIKQLDIRAYETDAYGSKEQAYITAIQRVVGSTAVRANGISASYSDRLAPQDFRTLAGVHEVCVSGGISLEDIEMLVVDQQNTDSFNDFEWITILGKNFAFDGDTRGQILRNMKNKIQDVWGDPEKARQLLTEAGVQHDDIEYLTAGIGLAPRERVIAMLKAKGIQEINGKKVEDFVVAGETFTRA